MKKDATPFTSFCELLEPRTLLSGTFTFPNVVSYPPPAIPALQQWESEMVSFGRQFGDPATVAAWPLPDFSTIGVNHEELCWYYDGERVFFQMMDYTGDASWFDSAQAVEAKYRPHALRQDNPGRPSYWETFALGLAMDYVATGDTPSLTGVRTLRDYTTAAYLGGIVDNRGTAYNADTDIADMLAGDARPSLLTPSINYLINGLGIYSYYQWENSFMVGLMAEALISYYTNVDQDSRILPAIKKTADWMWANRWQDSSRGFAYIDNYTTPSSYPSVLNLLISPMYGWLWRMTGESKYLDEGDAAFKGAVESGEVWGGKQFSQLYRWSFDYVKWRTDVPNPNDHTAPVISGVSAAAAQASDASGTTANTAFTWTTDEAADSVVEYGTTTAYGKVYSGLTGYKVKKHAAVVGPFTPGQIYHFRVKSTDSSGNVTYSTDYTFTAGLTSPVISVQANEEFAYEGPSAQPATFAFTRSGSTAGQLTAYYTIAAVVPGATVAINGTDYQTISGSVTFADGQATSTISILPINNAASQPTRFVQLSLDQMAGYSVSSQASTATIKIRDDENPISTISVTAINQHANQELGIPASFRITRSLTAGQLTVYYSIDGDSDPRVSSVSPSQYLPLSGYVTFADGQASQDVVLTPSGHSVAGNTAIAWLNLIPSASCNYLTSQADSASIYFDSSNYFVSIAGQDNSVVADLSEGATFTITRSNRGAPMYPLTVYYSLGGTAVNGADYQQIPASITFAADETSKTITIMPLDSYGGGKTVTATIAISDYCHYQIDTDSYAPFQATVSLTANAQRTLLGDCSGDLLINGQDIFPFIEALKGTTASAAADMNRDYVVNGQDIYPFLEALARPAQPSVRPEPAGDSTATAAITAIVPPSPDDSDADVALVAAPTNLEVETYAANNETIGFQSRRLITEENTEADGTAAIDLLEEVSLGVL